MDEIEELKKKVEEKQSQEIDFFKPKEQAPVEVKPQDKNQQLVENVFNQAVVHEVSNSEELKQKVLETAHTYVDTKMQTLATQVDSEHKEAVFDNNKDACESYGFNEKRTPLWAVKFMKVGYSIMLAIYIFLASFTVMPVIFLMKKIQVAVKRTWIAIILALIIYACVTFVPILAGIIGSR